MSDVERLKGGGAGAVCSPRCVPVKSLCTNTRRCDGVSCAGGGGQRPAPRRAY